VKLGTNSLNWGTSSEDFLGLILMRLEFNEEYEQQAVKVQVRQIQNWGLNSHEDQFRLEY
jgi:hypothetical protein